MPLKKSKNEKMVGVVGNGMVGGAIAHLFPEAKIYDIDPKRSNSPKEEINKCEFVFVCVPTDGSDNGYDYTPLNEAIEWVAAPNIIIKSTIEPGTTEALIKKTGKNIIFNPEFLRQKHRFEDIENETRIIIGTENEKAFENLKKLYLTRYNKTKINIIKTSPRIAEFVKIVNNSYLATKVIFCNEIKQILDRASIDYEEFREIWLLDQRIGESHTVVIPEGGFSGYCFPKDERALVNTAKRLGYDAKFLKEVWNSNCRFRDDFKGKEYKKDLKEFSSF